MKYNSLITIEYVQTACIELKWWIKIRERRKDWSACGTHLPSSAKRTKRQPSLMSVESVITFKPKHRRVCCSQLGVDEAKKLNEIKLNGDAGIKQQNNLILVNEWESKKLLISFCIIAIQYQHLTLFGYRKKGSLLLSFTFSSWLLSNCQS